MVKQKNVDYKSIAVKPWVKKKFDELMEWGVTASQLLDQLINHGKRTKFKFNKNKLSEVNKNGKEK